MLDRKSEIFSVILFVLLGSSSVQKMKQVQRLYSRKRSLEVSSQKYLFAMDKKLSRPPNKKFYYTRIVISAAVLVKSGKKAAYKAKLLALGGFASVVCICRRVD